MIRLFSKKRGDNGGFVVILFFIFHFSFGTSSCSSIDCPVQNTVAMNYTVCDLNGEAAALADTLWIWTQRSDGKDTLLNRITGKSEFTLPVSYSHPEDVLVLCSQDTALVLTLDTLWLKKEDIPHFESVDCSAHFFHKLTDVRYTRHALDSVAIIDRDVDYDNTKTHIMLRFRSGE